jgi:hypothetical protein
MSESQSEHVINPLELSDEELENYALPEEEETETVEQQEETDSPTEIEDLPEELDTNDSVDVEDENETDTEEDTDITENPQEEDTQLTESTGTDTKDTDTTLDYETEYKKILAPFTANGRTMQVDNVNEAITLMQMGANYNKKMAGLKPVLKLNKMLENNDLLDETKLSFLIDLSKHDTNAINKLVKEAGLENIDIDTDKATDYNPNTYTVNDKDVELDSVLDDIQGTDTYADTVDIISNKWDEASRKVLASNPGIISLINDQMGNGIFQQISTAVDKARMLGRYTGLSDIEAYKTMGDEIQAANGFVPANSNANDNMTPVSKSKQKDPKLTQRKKAAASPRAKPKSNITKKEYHPLALSDEEFAKMAAPNFT